MTSDSAVDENFRMFEEIWPRLRDDINAIGQELGVQGYRVLPVYPRHVKLTQVQGKLGFLVTIPNEKARDLMTLLGSGLRYTVDVEFGLHKNLAVFVITLKNIRARWAVLYVVYYHTGAEWLIRDQGKKGFFTFFRTQSGHSAGWVDMGNYQAYLYTRYQRRT